MSDSTKPGEPITCRMKFDGYVFRFCTFTTPSLVSVEADTFMDFVEISAFEAMKLERDAAIRERDEWKAKYETWFEAYSKLDDVNMRLSSERDAANARVAELQEGLRKALLWAECVLFRVPTDACKELNYTYLNDARKALQGAKVVSSG